MNIFSLFFLGVKYSKLWPYEIKLLNNVFKEGYIVYALVVARKYFPPILCLYLLWLYYFYVYVGMPFNYYLLPVPLIFVIVIFLLPVISYLYLGKKANTELSEKHKQWYRIICKYNAKEAELTPRYIDLAKALTIAKKQCGDMDFLKLL